MGRGIVLAPSDPRAPANMNVYPTCMGALDIVDVQTGSLFMFPLSPDRRIITTLLAPLQRRRVGALDG